MEKKITTDLGSRITNYIRWYQEDCTDPHDELEWLINLVIDGGGRQKDEMIEVLEAINQGYVPDSNNKF
jgi:hypothetical protein